MTATVQTTSVQTTTVVTAYATWCEPCGTNTGPFGTPDEAQQWANVHNTNHHTENTQ